MQAVRAHRGARCVRPGLLLGLVVLAGCAAFPDGARYGDMGREWRRARPRAADTAANDALFAAAPSLERGELVRRVLERNPSLAAAHYAWRAALERYPQAVALDDPTLGWAIAPRTLRSSDFEPTQRFDLSQRIPFPGKRGLAGSAALAEAEASAQDFAATRVRLAALASALFDDYYLAGRALAISAEHADLLRVHAGSALARYASGAGSQQDPLQAEMEIAQLERQELEFQDGLREARARLNALLHRAPELPLPPPPEVLALPEPPALEAQLDARPDLAAAAARVRAREAELAGARRAFLPDLTLRGSYDESWSEKELRPMVGFEVELPLQLARKRAGVREARARLGQAENEAAERLDGARLELLRAQQELERAQGLRALYRDKLLPTARERVEAARAGFESGRNGFAELVDAEHELR
ncbi:MAG TPA: TolC family protein, partial [Myxococcota bacterium]|nr:TolC family protein [Myxococcota bacterium]